MSFVMLYTKVINVENARKEYMKLIWQDDEPKGFKIKFENNLTKDLIFGHITRLDNDQCDWLGQLPNYINYIVLREIQNEEAAMNVLTHKLAELNYVHIV